MSSPTSHIDLLILERYLSGECTSSERAVVERWAEASQENKVELDRWWAAHRMSRRYVAPVVWRDPQTDRAWSGARGKLTPPSVSVALPSPARRSWLPWWATVGLSAGVVIVVVVGIVAFSELGPGEHTYATVAGERSSVTLSDGTRIDLAPSSRVHVPTGYGHGEREVDLRGEAYFAVVHDIQHPFMVRAHGAVITDIGTQFDIRAYAGEPRAQVAVTEGIVSVGAGGSAFGPTAVSFPEILHVGDIATVSSNGLTVAHGGNVVGFTSWRQGELVFEDTPLDEAVRTLSRTFDLTITVDTGLSKQLVTGTFGNVPVNEVLDEVARIVGAEYVRHGKSVAIRRRVSASEKRPLPLNVVRAG